uniref:Putative secreted protein n=1 Tax=Ixodes ricinus TaxID=34613 RepID=A0A6B0UM39_IXORI
MSSVLFSSAVKIFISSVLYLRGLDAAELLKTRSFGMTVLHADPVGVSLYVLDLVRHRVFCRLGVFNGVFSPPACEQILDLYSFLMSFVWYRTCPQLFSPLLRGSFCNAHFLLSSSL